MAVINLCSNCEATIGEKSKYCRHCITPEMRKKAAEENTAIRTENAGKGFKV